MKKYKNALLRWGLFFITLLVTTFAGMEWVASKSILVDGFDIDGLKKGFLWYALPFLGFLTVHEFGHYFMAKIRKVSVTPPYYIPFWLAMTPSFGTMGAFIKINDLVNSRKKYFDIGIAGPLAGFVVALFALIYGYSHLPDHTFVYAIHPEYAQYGTHYGDYVYDEESIAGALRLGDSLLSHWIKITFADPARMPHINELTHYPFILAGFLGLFFTALNLMPIGQLDGGHILFSMLGPKWFNRVSPVLFTLFIFYAGLGFYTIEEMGQLLYLEGYRAILNFIVYVYVTYLSFSRMFEDRKLNWIMALSVIILQLLVNNFWPEAVGYSGFLAFGLLLGRFLGIYHPPVMSDKKLDFGRILLGIFALIIFVLCISPAPFY